MATIDDLAIEMVNAKEQLKSINNTINKDRKIVSDLEKGIEEKNKEIKKLEKEIEEKNDEIASLDSTKNKAEEEYGAIRDNLKAEIKKLNESKKKDEEKYQIMVEELSNDVKVLTNRKQELKLTIEGLEDEIRKTRADKDNEVALKDREIKEVKEKLDSFNLLFDEQDGLYRKTAREIEDMNKKLEEKDGLIAECWKLDRSIEEKTKRLVEVRDEIIGEEDRLMELRNEINELENRKMEEENEIADYVKKKLELKDRKDALDNRERYLRKRFEEAGIDF